MKAGEKFVESGIVSQPQQSDASKPLKVFRSKTTGPIGADEPRYSAPMTTPESAKPSPTFVSKTTGPFGGPPSIQVNAFDELPIPGQSARTGRDPRGGGL